MILQTKPAVAVPLPSGFFLPKAPKTIPIREVKIPIKLRLLLNLRGIVT